MSTDVTAVKKRSKFPKDFWLANSMDIFERFAWFGFWAVSGLYMTDSIANGGLGFNDIQRGVVQGVIPFLLYLMTVATGALSDRYGYRKMFLISFAILIPAYYMLGQVHNFWGFFIVFFIVAVGAAIYKPLVVATISHVTDDSNRGVGFGINYTLVNLGATAGIFVAGFVRSISWDLVFVMAAAWLSFNFILLYFYREPTQEAFSENKRDLKQVLLDAQEVLGNARLALMVFIIILALMVLGGKWISLSTFFIFTAAVIFINLIWSSFCSSDQKTKPWYLQKIKIGNWPFVTYLLILAGFWTMYNQLFLTMPLYIRDYIDTASLVQMLDGIIIFNYNLGEIVTTANLNTATSKLTELSTQFSSTISTTDISTIKSALLETGIRVPNSDIVNTFQILSVSTTPESINNIAALWVQKYAQINPEFLLSINFVSIVLFQILVSMLIDRFNVVMVLVAGCVICTASWLVGGFAHMFAYASLFTVLTILIFSFGEMVTSPKSTEYVATIAPKNKVCMFMGYYFVCIALGNLFGGLISGRCYQFFSVEMNRPELMWLLFASIGVATTIAFLIFNRTVIHHLNSQQQKPTIDAVDDLTDEDSELITS